MNIIEQHQRLRGTVRIIRLKSRCYVWDYFSNNKIVLARSASSYRSPKECINAAHKVTKIGFHIFFGGFILGALIPCLFIIFTY